MSLEVIVNGLRHLKVKRLESAVKFAFKQRTQRYYDDTHHISGHSQGSSAARVAERSSEKTRGDQVTQSKNREDSNSLAERKRRNVLLYLLSTLLAELDAPTLAMPVTQPPVTTQTLVSVDGSSMPSNTNFRIFEQNQASTKYKNLRRGVHFA